LPGRTEENNGKPKPGKLMPDQDSNSKPPEYKLEALPFEKTILLENHKNLI
jgi:hypothetical protein